MGIQSIGEMYFCERATFVRCLRDRNCKKFRIVQHFIPPIDLMTFFFFFFTLVLFSVERYKFIETVRPALHVVKIRTNVIRYVRYMRYAKSVKMFNLKKLSYSESNKMCFIRNLNKTVMLLT